MSLLPVRLFMSAIVCSALAGGDLAPPLAAKFVRLLAGSTGGRVACQDKELAAELTALGVPLDASAKLVWVSSEADAARLSKQGKMVVCGQLAFLGAGASVAVVAEGGRPTLYLNRQNLATAGVTLPDAMLKVAKVVK